MHRRIVSNVPWLLVLLLGGAAAAADTPPSWISKVDPWVLGSAHFGATEFLVVLAEQADLSAAARLATKEEKGRFVIERLREVAARTQPPVIAALAARGVEYRPYWVVNMIWVRGGTDTVQAMAERGDVARLAANPSVNLNDLLPAQNPDRPAATDSIEWNITKTGAPSVWALGYRGQGVVAAGQDTGYQWDHPALKSQYRGWNGSVANHNYNWHDAIHSGGGVCGPNSPFPCDDHGHGTHTMGTMVGDDGGSNQIGMAPGARWIGCRNMNQGVGTPTTYAECFQWFIAPTDLSGQNPDPSKAPDVINNSWGCPPSEGCTDPLVLQSVVQNTVAAGITVVVSAGNDGPGCSSVTSPPAIYGEVISVGATDSYDGIASFSSRGPVTVDGSNRQKPNVSAPGVNIRSSVPGSTYEGGWNGTSMAGPHVAGEVALLLSAAPTWKGQTDLIANRIEQSAVPRTTTETCGGLPGSAIPNNTYGWGRIDALAAVNVADLVASMTAAPNPAVLGADLVYTIQVANLGPRGAAAVTVTDILPANADFIGSSAWCTPSGSTLTCTLGALPAQRQSNFTVTVRPSSTDPVVNTATATSSQTDPDPSNNQVTLTTPVTVGTDVVLAATAAPDPVLVGTELSYQLSVTNAGPIAATGVVVTDVLPAAANFVSATAPCANTAGTITCDLGNLTAGTSVPLAIVLTPTAAGSLVNVPSVSTTTADSDPTNNAVGVATSVVTPAPVALEIDGEAATGSTSDVNGVLEPGEVVSVRPAWANPSAAGAEVSGTASNFTGPSGADYTLADVAASYGLIPSGGAATFCLDCYLVGVSTPTTRPALHWDATVSETLSTGETKTWTLHVGDSFLDAGRNNWAYGFIETILHAGVTTGCDPGQRLYCPNDTVARDQMGVFIARAMAGGDANVPTTGTLSDTRSYDCSSGGVSLFADIAPTSWACRHVHYLYAANVTTGCNPAAGLYCPSDPVTRGSMAVFIARAVAGGETNVPMTYTDAGTALGYSCDPASPNLHFADVGVNDWYCKHVHYLWATGAINGCDPAAGLYCPAPSVLRTEMAKFLTNGFHLALYGP